MVKNRSHEQINKHLKDIIRKLRKKHNYDPDKSNFDDVIVTEENMNWLGNDNHIDTDIDANIYERIILKIFSKGIPKENEYDSGEFAFKSFCSWKRHRQSNNGTGNKQDHSFSSSSFSSNDDTE